MLYSQIKTISLSKLCSAINLQELQILLLHDTLHSLTCYDRAAQMNKLDEIRVLGNGVILFSYCIFQTICCGKEDFIFLILSGDPYF